MRGIPTILIPGLLVVGCDDPTALRKAPPFPAELTIITALDPDRAVQHVHVEPLGSDLPPANLRGRLYEDGVLVATAATGAVEGDAGARLSRCAETFGGQLSLRRGDCLEFSWWPRHGSRYRVEIEADGHRTAAGETRIPGPFDIETLTTAGAPPGSEGLTAAWTPSAAAHMYVVAVRAESPVCGGASCRTGWYAETPTTSVEVIVPPEWFEEADIGSSGYVIEVVALDRPLYEYLTTGAAGSLFPVPPIENVTGGRGVVGSWVRRPAHADGQGGWAQGRVIERGEWEAVPLPDDDVQEIAWLGTIPSGLLARGSHGIHYLPHGTRSWSTLFRGHVADLAAFGGDGYAVLGDGRELWRIRSEGTSAALARVAALDGFVRTFLVSPHEQNIVVALVGNAGAVLRSGDGGGTFETVTLPAIAEGPYEIWSLIEDAALGLLYAILRPESGTATHRVAQSTDGGVNWTVTGAPLAGGAVDAAAGSGALYAAVHQGSAGAYASRDGGESWELIADGFVFTVDVEPSTPTVWLGARWAPADYGFQWSEGGIIVSQDGGASFRSFGLQGASVVDLAVTPNGAEVVALTHEKGLVRHAVIFADR